VEGYREEERVAFLLTGRAGPRHWSGTERWADIYDLKGAVGDLLERLSLDKAHVISYSAFDGLTEDTLAVEIHGATAGTFGRVRSEVVNLFGIEQEVFVAELDVRMLKGEMGRVYRPLPRYPKVSRDVAFVVSAEVPAGKMVEVIRRAGGELLQQVEVFDVYQGDRLPQGKKSLAFSLELLSREGTLVDAQIDAAVQSVVRAVEEECGATLRSAH
jgi:phenylalanyl-tRNA synthetase beta chain